VVGLVGVVPEPPWASLPHPPRPAPPPRGAPGTGAGQVNGKVTELLLSPFLREKHKELFLFCLLIALIKLSLKNLRGVHQWGPGSLQALAYITATRAGEATGGGVGGRGSLHHCQDPRLALPSFLVLQASAQLSL
jgi:hypothetical protein